MNKTNRFTAQVQHFTFLRQTSKTTDIRKLRVSKLPQIGTLAIKLLASNFFIYFILINRVQAVPRSKSWQPHWPKYITIKGVTLPASLVPTVPTYSASLPRLRLIFILMFSLQVFIFLSLRLLIYICK